MIDVDRLRERLRERVTEPADDYMRGECRNCQATLTAADVEQGECSQCGSTIDGDDEDLVDEVPYEHVDDLWFEEGY
jgi:hypothetical protein